jgi:MFS family permease
MSMEFVALVLVLPALTSILPASFRKASVFTKDKTLAQWSCGALAIGMLCLGLAPVVGLAIVGIVVLALGSGQDSLTRSMATEMVSTGDISVVYSAITMLRAIGGSISGPLSAWLYTVGLKQKGAVWLGLPYLVAGALFVLAVTVLTFVRNSKEDEVGADDEAREPLLA